MPKEHLNDTALHATLLEFIERIKEPCKLTALDTQRFTAALAQPREAKHPLMNWLTRWLEGFVMQLEVNEHQNRTVKHQLAHKQLKVFHSKLA